MAINLLPTASEARTIANNNKVETPPPVVVQQLEIAMAKIMEAARTGRFTVALHDWWAHEGYGPSENYKLATAELVKAGYVVRFFYEDCQLVNMYTIVSW